MNGTGRVISTNAPFDDARLQELALEPVEDLFPAMKSASAAAPWLVVFAFLPLVCGAMAWTLNDHCARWALRALDAARSTGTPSAQVLANVPPLATWLTAWLMRVFGAESRIVLISVSSLAVAGTVFSAARLGRRLGGPRVAFLTVLCCAGHPLLLNCTQTCSPESLGACLMTVSLERFLAHLDGSVGIWSGRLLASGLAWGGCMLALGWPALALGIVLMIHALLCSASPGALTAPAIAARQNFRRSLAVWWFAGVVSGGWLLISALRAQGMAAAFDGLIESEANPISPLFPDASRIVHWGTTMGHLFLLGWMALGVFTVLRNPQALFSEQNDGRALAVLLWWLILFLGRSFAAQAGADPTLWDVLQVVPACLMAASGMEAVLQRTVSREWLLSGILVGLWSLAVHVPLGNTPALHGALFAGTLVCLTPLIWNLVQARSVRWTEGQIRTALCGLLLSTAIAHLGWGVAQAFPGTVSEVRLAEQLAKLKDSSPPPGAVVIVTDSPPSRALVFQLRRTWPQAPLIVADRWETAVSQLLPSVGNWSDAEFLVVELTRRDSQFRRPGAGWIVSPAGEPRRYRGDKLTLHRVSIQSP